jgi:hypothetical protein
MWARISRIDGMKYLGISLDKNLLLRVDFPFACGAGISAPGAE